MLFLFLLISYAFSIKFITEHFNGNGCDTAERIGFTTYGYEGLSSLSQSGQYDKVEGNDQCWKNRNNQYLKYSLGYNCNNTGLFYTVYFGEECDGTVMYQTQALQEEALQCVNYGNRVQFSRKFGCDSGVIDDSYAHITFYKDGVCSEETTNRAVNYYVKLDKCFKHQALQQFYSNYYFKLVEEDDGQLQYNVFSDDECTTEVATQTKKIRKGICVEQEGDERRAASSSMKFIDFGESEVEDGTTSGAKAIAGSFAVVLGILALLF